LKKLSEADIQKLKTEAKTDEEKEEANKAEQMKSMIKVLNEATAKESLNDYDAELLADKTNWPLMVRIKWYCIPN